MVNYAFIFGELQTGAKLKGFVYFPLLPKDISSATLYVKGYRFNLALVKK
ncbi:MAG: hypothetical protein ABDH18_03220 [Aquificaceae bacterium]